LDLLGRGDIGRCGERVGPQAIDSDGKAIAIDVRDRQARTSRGQCFGRGQPDPPRRARDERDVPPQMLGLLSVSFAGSGKHVCEPYVPPSLNAVPGAGVSGILYCRMSPRLCESRKSCVFRS